MLIVAASAMHLRIAFPAPHERRQNVRRPVPLPDRPEPRRNRPIRLPFRRDRLVFFFGQDRLPLTAHPLPICIVKNLALIHDIPDDTRPGKDVLNRRCLPLTASGGRYLSLIPLTRQRDR